jgi:hypothetical protein
VLYFIKTSLLNLLVLLHVLLERIFELGESRLRPVESRDVDLVDSLGAGSRKRSKETTVEAGLERKNREIRASGGMVIHSSVKFLSAEINLRATTLLLSAPHKGGLVGSLVRIRASHGGKDIIQTLGSNSEKTGLEKIGPVVRGEGSEGRSVDNGVHHLRAGGGLEKGRVVITDCN